jgi:diaminohydroxyphosphoribosylaminopyrimidine deaminase/5-amino-6-(5-phosphoribosylamino)uracil reductase
MSSCRSCLTFSTKRQAHSEQSPMTSRGRVDDETWMRLALALAERGQPSPNPHVGAVLVRPNADAGELTGEVMGEAMEKAMGEVIGEGHHERAGLAHAEVAAIADARRRGHDVRGATLYVTMEPCNHTGRTGPCTDAILEAGVARVVVGARDPRPHVPGAIDKLQAAGVSVTTDVCGPEARRVIADFTKHITTGLPYVVAKFAMTLDGKIATSSGDSKWVTGEPARAYAHGLRARADAVMIGIGTALADDPELTVRLQGSAPSAVRRVVLDPGARLPVQSRLVQSARDTPLHLFHGEKANPDKLDALRSHGVHTEQVACSDEGLQLYQVLQSLGKRDVVRVLVEGGASVHSSLFAESLVDYCYAIIAPKVLADDRAKTWIHGRSVQRMQDAWPLGLDLVTRVGHDVVLGFEVRALLKPSE